MVARVYLGQYEVVRALGEGGMGKAYLGRRLDDGRQVVIKVMHDHIAADSRFRQGFVREMKLMTRFRHPHAVALHEASLDDAHQPCIIMEYVPGISLEALVERQGRLPPERVGRFLGQLCLVLHAAHGAGILHRDLSCANLMVVDAGRPHEKIKVMDFGLARMGTGFYIPLQKLTGSPSSIGGGTPDYVCPEQVRGNEVDHRGDLYSVGVVLFKLLTGRLPFEDAETANDILRSHLEKAPPSFAQLGVHDVPEGIERLVHTLLAKYPAERPADARTLAGLYANALGQAIPHDDFDARDVELPPPPSPEIELDPRTVLDQFEAWMPEQIAVMKLRGFVQDVGGDVVDSEPGMIRVRLLDPRTIPARRSGGILSLLGLGRKTLSEPSALALELHMAKKEVDQRALVGITVVLPPDEKSAPEEEIMRRGFGERICRELRAYLMCR